VRAWRRCTLPTACCDGGVGAYAYQPSDTRTPLHCILRVSRPVRRMFSMVRQIGRLQLFVLVCLPPCVASSSRCFDRQREDHCFLMHWFPLAANRAFAHLKTEAFGLAIADADSAIALDKTYAKAYYRRASAKLALGKTKEALKDFRAVVTMKPTNKVRACLRALHCTALHCAAQGSLRA